MSRSLGTLTLDLVARTGGWVQGMDKSQRTSRRWRRQVERDMQQVSRAIKVAAAAAIGAFTLMARTGQTFVDSQAKAADSLDGTIDGLRAAQIVAGDYNVSSEQLVSTVQRLNRELAGARDGTGNAAEALERLGLSADQLLAMDVDQRMATIANAVQQMGLSSAETGDLLRDLGVRNQDLINVLRGGGDAFAAAREEVNEYGLSLSRLDAARVERTNDAIGRLPRLLEPIRTQLAVSLADPLKGITDQWLEMGKATGGFRDEIDSMVDFVVNGVLFVIDVVDGINRAFQLAGSGIALMAIESARHLYRMADVIYNGPIEAVNWLIEQINRIPGINLGTVDQGEFGRALEQNRAMFAEASRIARQDMQDTLMAPMASEAYRASIEAARASTPELAANEAAEDFAETVDDASDSVEDYATETRSARDTVRDFGRAVQAGAVALEGMAERMRDPRYTPGAGGDTSSERARARFEATAFRPGDASVIDFGGNPDARPTHSTQYLTTAGQQLSQTAQSVTGGGGAGRTAQVTLNVVGEGGSQSATGLISETLLSMLEGAAAGTS